MIREFQYTFEDLEILPKDIAELLGFSINAIPDPFPKLIESALNEAPGLCEIRAGFKYFDHVEINLTQQNIIIDNQIFTPNKIIFTQIKNASSIAIFICTAGKEISNWSKQLAVTGDDLSSFIFDVIGSLAAEKAREKLEIDLKKDINTLGLNISDAYSPGYCDWSLSEQQNLFALLPLNFCGITLTEALLMYPVKSVSGLIGVGKSMKQKGYQCNWCNDVNCLYSKIKRQKKN